LGRFLAMASVIIIPGCAVGPDFVQPLPPDVSGYTRGSALNQTVSSDGPGGATQRLQLDRDVPGEWWRIFRSRGLTSLIDEAIRNNYDLQAAQAALRVARANKRAQFGAFFPSVDGNLSAIRQKVPVDYYGAPGDPAIFNLFTGQVSVSYTPDVFGANRRAVESLEAQEENQRFQLEATHLTLTSNIALAAIQEASLRGQLEATRKTIKIATDVLELLRRQKSAGQVADADVVQQEAALAQVEQTLPLLQRQLLQQRHLIAALAGRFPSEEPEQKFLFAALHLPQDLPLSLPSALVEQRPDIRAAEANLRSANAQIGVAVANRLPNITLTAAKGSTAFEPAQLFSPGTGFWNLAGAATQPIFRGGTLLFQERAARAAFDQAAAQYKSTVINAFQNVADTLSALQTDAVALQKAVATERAAARSLEIMRQRLTLGDVNYLALLNAQQTYQQALVNLVQARANRYADTVALYQALGGGWWNRNDILPEKPLSIAGIFQ
jgi:NodT family efflux transporter outer membrane factor (OMF) lipoprotein